MFIVLLALISMMHAQMCIVYLLVRHNIDGGINS